MRRVTIAEKVLLDKLLANSVSLRTMIGLATTPALLKLLRQRLRMTQRTLAERSGIPQSTLGRIEAGTVQASIRTLQRLFDALFCDLLIVPVPRQDLNEVVTSRAHSKAGKRIAYLTGTMALEEQRPDPEILKALLEQEQTKLLSSGGNDLWAAEE